MSETGVPPEAESTQSSPGGPTPESVPAPREHRLPFRAWVDLLLTWPAAFSGVAFAVGIGLTVTFVDLSAALADRELDRSAKTTKGRIHPPIQPTGWSVGGRTREGGRQIFRYDFSYEVENRQYTGASYSTGKGRGPGEAEVEYSPSRPEVARVKGTRLSMTAFPSALLCLIPVAAFLYILGAILVGWLRVRSLTRGLITEARILEAHVVRGTEGGTDAWRFSFEFQTSGGETVQGKDLSALLSEPKPGDPIDIIYPPAREHHCRYLGNLVQPLEFDDHGNYEAHLSASAVTRLALFVLSMGGPVVYGVWRWLG